MYHLYTHHAQYVGFVATKPGHLFVSLLSHCKYVRVQVTHVLAGVRVDDRISVDGKLFVRIDRHKDNT